MPSINMGSDRLAELLSEARCWALYFQPSTWGLAYLLVDVRAGTGYKLLGNYFFVDDYFIER